MIPFRRVTCTQHTPVIGALAPATATASGVGKVVAQAARTATVKGSGR